MAFSANSAAPLADLQVLPGVVGRIEISLVSGLSAQADAFARVEGKRAGFLRHALDFGLGGKLAAIGFGERLVNFFDLPTVQGEVISNGFRSKEGAGAAGGSGEFIQLAGEVVVQAGGENFLGSHGCLANTSDYIVFG